MLFAPSVKATAPAALSRPISASSSPSRPLVSAAIGCTCTIAVSRARRITKSTIAGSSITGSVSGWHTMVVTPPAAAASARGCERLAIFGAGLADEGAHVDEAGRDEPAVAIDDLGAFRHARRADAALCVADHAVGNQQVAGEIEIARRIDDPGIGEQDRAAVREHALSVASASSECAAFALSPCGRGHRRHFNIRS